MDTLTDRLSGSRAYQPMDSDILDTIDEMQGSIERGGRVATSDIDLQDLGGNVERGGDFQQQIILLLQVEQPHQKVQKHKHQ